VGVPGRDVARGPDRHRDGVRPSFELAGVRRDAGGPSSVHRRRSFGASGVAGQGLRCERRARELDPTRGISRCPTCNPGANPQPNAEREREGGDQGLPRNESGERHEGGKGGSDPPPATSTARTGGELPLGHAQLLLEARLPFGVGRAKTASERPELVIFRSRRRVRHRCSRPRTQQADGVIGAIHRATRFEH
jgi:hypothetical protein